jgi:hypothetical protein
VFKLVDGVRRGSRDNYRNDSDQVIATVAQINDSARMPGSVGARSAPTAQTAVVLDAADECG